MVTGFLGSGKTTLVNRLVSHKHFKDTALIINEFGDIGIDHLLVREVDEQMVMLTKGCVCCTVRADIVTTLKELFQKRAAGAIPKFKRVLIETTGIADPAPVVYALTHSPIAKRFLYLDTVVTAIDPVHVMNTLEHHEECLRQIAVADVLMLTKRDLVSNTDALSIKDQIHRLNPNAIWQESENGDASPSHFFGNSLFVGKKAKPDLDQWLSSKKHDHSHSSKHKSIETFTILREKPLSMQTFQAFHSTLLNFKDANILRIKGVLNIESAEGPLLIHGVQHVLSPLQWLKRWPSKDQRTRIVFITKGVSKDSIECMLSGFERTANVEMHHKIRPRHQT